MRCCSLYTGPCSVDDGGALGQGFCLQHWGLAQDMHVHSTCAGSFGKKTLLEVDVANEQYACPLYELGFREYN